MLARRGGWGERQRFACLLTLNFQRAVETVGQGGRPLVSKIRKIVPLSPRFATTGAKKANKRARKKKRSSCSCLTSLIKGRRFKTRNRSARKNRTAFVFYRQGFGSRKTLTNRLFYPNGNPRCPIPFPSTKNASVSIRDSEIEMGFWMIQMDLNQ